MDKVVIAKRSGILPENVERVPNDRSASSRQHLLDHVAFHIREAALEAVVLEG